MDLKPKYLEIQSLVLSLNISQLESLKIFLSSFYEKYSTSESVYLDYVKHMEHEENTYEMFLESYGGSPDGIRKNFERLRDKIFDSLSSDLNLQRKGTLSTTWKHRMQIKKDIFKGLLAYTMNSEEQMLYFMRRALKNAIRHEYFKEGIEASTQILEIVRTRKIKYGVKKVRLDRELLIAQDEYFERVKKLRRDVDAEAVKEFHDLVLIGELRSKIDAARLDAAGNSFRAEREILYAELVLFSFVEDWEKCYAISLNIQNLILSNPQMVAENELGIIGVNLGIFGILGQNYAQAEVQIRKSFEHLSKKGYLLTASQENLFLALFYQSKSAEAEELLNEELLGGPFGKSPMYASKWNYWRSIILFQEGDFRGSLDLLAQSKEIEKDKEGWNLYIRMLRIMNMIELQKFDLAENETENFRRYLEGKKYSRRVKEIFRVFRSLARSGFEFRSQKAQMEKLNATLGEKELIWNPTSPELLRIDEWLKSKAEVS
jgi:hypothetical protein